MNNNLVFTKSSDQKTLQFISLLISVFMGLYILKAYVAFILESLDESLLYILLSIALTLSFISLAFFIIFSTIKYKATAPIKLILDDENLQLVSFFSTKTIDLTSIKNIIKKPKQKSRTQFVYTVLYNNKKVLLYPKGFDDFDKFISQLSIKSKVNIFNDF